MAHTREEQWHNKREKLREGVTQYYRAKKIARMLQCEMGIGDLPNVDPWRYQSGSMREMAQLLRRSIHALETDRKSLGLTPKLAPEITYAWEDRVIRHNRFYSRDVPGFSRKMMSVEDFAEQLDKMMQREWDKDFVFPKYFYELVERKGIAIVKGSTRFRYSPTIENRSHHSGNLLVCHAREIKADWLANDDIRAFKVVVLPDSSKTVYGCAVGYVARSTLTDFIEPAFGEDITKAVSLCKRRVKAEVMKQMGV